VEARSGMTAAGSQCTAPAGVTQEQVNASEVQP